MPACVLYGTAANRRERQAALFSAVSGHPEKEGAQVFRHRCLITGEYPLVLAALSQLLKDEFVVDFVSSDLDEFTDQVEELQPDVVIIDRDPDDYGLQLRQRAMDIRPRPAVLFLASREFSTNGLNCISRSCSLQQFLWAIRTAVRDVRVSPGKSRRNQLPPDDMAASGPHLSIREQQVLRGVASGKPMKEVARDLGITPRTVAFHKYKVMQTNGLRNNYDLLQFCMKNGLLCAAGNVLWE